MVLKNSDIVLEFIFDLLKKFKPSQNLSIKQYKYVIATFFGFFFSASN